jgi:uncharacterized protein involved in response to NO
MTKQGMIDKIVQGMWGLGMGSATDKGQDREPAPLAVLSYAFRPMFLAASAWAIVAIALWFPFFLGHMQLPTRFDPLSWHVHEMLFGFVMAAVAGFLLTAIPNWTGRLPVRGRPLALLVGFWALGRLACLVSEVVPAWLAILADLLFPAALLAVAAREILVGRNWRNLPMTAPLAVFLIADLLMHLETIDVPVPGGLGWRLGLVAPILLISVIGGRIIPSFTRNWLAKRDATRLPAAQGPVDIVAVGLTSVGMVAWAVIPDALAPGAILVIAAIANAWRLARWAGLATWAEPLLFVLHVGYGWLVIGLALLGFSILSTSVPTASAIHALTAGAIATMILAVMPRVSLGHTGRDLAANRATIAMFILITAAGIARVCASWQPDGMMTLVALSSACWIAAFGLFVIAYGPILTRPRPARPDIAR